jgi:hypothetical protein
MNTGMTYFSFSLGSAFFCFAFAGSFLAGFAATGFAFLGAPAA